ncbi:Imidazolonepropionase [Dethiosulfatibacter aminovorans DSM 17477]|uniref:Imidazolonepropionase n=1 Tax=Dethiosulfatibacter aminovorans DSM 17477 TaxID=1121476 RepID=A0A1M6C1V1_9FIRM|nr:amidohydrolase family protein [Dethiosulfatibacter aminovorans]SHI55025.1 Imidazolonepropionase [Dethiosulfatibacter aminovorans DSM 17477]
MYWIKNANVITCKDDAILENHCIQMENGVISKIVPVEECQPDKGSTIIDAKGEYVLPGLINCHEHVLVDDKNMSTDLTSYEHTIMKSVAYLEDILKSGFTTVRSMMDFYNLEMVFRDAIESGVIKGPSLVVAGKAMTATGGHFGQFLPCCDTVELARKYTNEQLSKGADFIKVYLTGGVTTVGVANAVNVKPECLDEIVSIAHDAGKKVAAHCIGGQGVLVAAKAGVDSIEHGSGLDEVSGRYMLENQITLVPTILPGYMNNILPDRESLPEFFRVKSDQYLEDCKKAAAFAREMGIKIAVGTDGGAINTPHDIGALELSLLSEQGYTPMECILAATVNAADLLGMSGDRGTVEIGKRGDLIIVDQNPLEQLECLQDVKHVFKEGVLIR